MVFLLLLFLIKSVPTISIVKLKTSLFFCNFLCCYNNKNNNNNYYYYDYYNHHHHTFFINFHVLVLCK